MKSKREEEEIDYDEDTSGDEDSDINDTDSELSDGEIKEIQEEMVSVIWSIIIIKIYYC